MLVGKHSIAINRDNMQESIIEYRYYMYDDTAKEWRLEYKDCGMQAIWDKR